MFDNLDIEDIVRAIITLIFVGVFAYMTITGNPVTAEMTNILLIVIGFYFGVNELGKVVGKIFDRRRNGVK